MKLQELCVLSALLYSSLVHGDQVEIPLNGDSGTWTISDSEGRVKGLPATVPGQVHLDLLRHGVIKEPYDGWNDWLEQWVAYDNWVYTRTFVLTKDQINGMTVWLKCDGLDTAANISVNGMMMGQGNNMHRRYFFDLTGVVTLGQNTIDIAFESAANYSVRMANAYPYSMYSGGDYFNDSMRNFVRKTQSDFGWDWGPAFVPTGIWQNISLVTFKSVYVSYVIPKTYFSTTSKEYFVTVTVCVELPSLAITPYDINVKVSAPNIPAVDGHFQASAVGETCGTITGDPITPADVEPYLWWPSGVGKATPNLLESTTDVDILDGSEQISHYQEVKNIGFRFIEVAQDPVGKDGLTFYFRMNTTHYGSYPIYAKGSNFIPMDAFVSRATPDYARRLLQSAVDGNQNMIRVWGGGLYQPDWFYDLCDELGLMVWQEMMFADALYPRDMDFLSNVQAEVRHQVRKLSHHPSIVLWSGNNENQGIAQGNDALLIDYSVLYDQIVRATLWVEDVTRPFWPSSPSNGIIVDDPDRQLYIQRWGDSSNSNYGDVHRYDYDDYCTDVTKFPRPRFASEFGFQSYPSFNSLANISSPVDWDNNSTFMLHRQHHPSGNKQMQTMMGYFFNLPNNMNKTVEFMDFVYLSQVVQSICIGAEAEHYRRLLSEEGTFTRGTLYWQLNDIWQAQSWASVEYTGRWKLLHYNMKRIYEPVLVSPYEMDGVVSIYVVVDDPDMSLNYTLEVQVISWEKGAVLNKFEETSLTASGFTGVKVWNMSIVDIFKVTNVNESFLYIQISDATKISRGGVGQAITKNVLPSSQKPLADSWYFPANFTGVKLAYPNISSTDFAQDTSQTSVSFVLTSVAVAPFVLLDSGSINGNFNDNGFLVLPTVKYPMKFTSWEPFELNDFMSQLRVRSIRDTY